MNNNDSRSTQDTAGVLDTVVVGGGQAGLAIGWHLAQQGRSFLVIDAHDRVGDAWRTRWDSLRLFTPAKYVGLPGMPFPGDPLSFPSKDEMADFLAAYAQRFDLPVVNGATVTSMTAQDNDGDGRFVVEAGDRRWTAENVVIATGGSQSPAVPAYARDLDASVVTLHSADYLNPSQLRPGPVLVVGVGNSGAEIARDVSTTHATYLSGRPSGEIPVRHGRTTARFVLPIVRLVGLHLLTLDTPLGRRAARSGRADPLIRTKLRDLEECGVAMVPRVTGVRDGMPVLDGGNSLDVANVIWCTGFRDDFSWIHLPAFDDEGHPRQHRGVVESVPGLFFLGQHFLYSAVSSTVLGVCRDSGYMAAQLAAGINSEVFRPAVHNPAVHNPAQS